MCTFYTTKVELFYLSTLYGKKYFPATIKTWTMTRLLLCLTMAVGLMLNAAQAQLLSWSPAFPTADDTLSIVFDASKGNRGLNGFTGDVYIHTGVITNLSTSRSDWKYVRTPWNVNNATYRLERIGTNLYRLRMSRLRDYYEVPAAEQMQRLAMVFRSYNPSGNPLEGKASDLAVDQGNIYVPIYPDRSLRVGLFQPESEARFNRFVLPIRKAVGETIALQARSSEEADLKLFYNGVEVKAGTGVSVLDHVQTIGAVGNQRIIAEANKGALTVRDTIDFFVEGATEVAPLPSGVKQGINYLPGNTSATLVLFAPGKNSVRVLGDFNNWTESQEYVMKKTPDGNLWWITINGLTPGTEYAYQYLIDGTLRVADPYTEKVLDPFNDGEIITKNVYPNLKPYPVGKTSGIVGVLQTAKPTYTWQVNNFQRPDKRNLLIYELLVRDFTSKHNWKELKDTLPYLKRLGINAIELMPFNEFEGNKSWGYNPSFYFAADKFYGTELELKAFIDECHRNGIAVIMDMVLNHSFGQSPMVQMYFDAANNRPAANNPWFNPTARHPFNVGYDMNHEAAATKYFFSRVCEYWLKEYKIDGYRFDLSKGFTQKNTCTTGDCGSGNEVNNWSLYDETRVAIWKAYYDTLMKHAPGSYVILEHLSENREEQELSNYGMLFWGKGTDQFNEATIGAHDNNRSDFSGVLHTRRGWQNPHLVGYMESHDEERLMYKNLQFGINTNPNHNARTLPVASNRNAAAAAFFWMMPGPKMMWQFGELGYDFSINYCGDGAIRNECRTDDKPIRWDYLQNTDRRRLLAAYDSLLQLRTHPLFKDTWNSSQIDGSFNNSNGLKWMSVRTQNDTSSVLVVGNFGLNGQTITVSFPKAGPWFHYGTTDFFEATGNAQTIFLQPGEYRVYLSRDIHSLRVPTPVVDVDPSGGVFRLGVYPNPVSSYSVVQYQLPDAGRFELSVTDMGGRMIGRPYQIAGVPGNYQISLQQLTGQPLTSGMYFLRVRWKNRVFVERMVVGK